MRSIQDPHPSDPDPSRRRRQAKHYPTVPLRAATGACDTARRAVRVIPSRRWRRIGGGYAGVEKPDEWLGEDWNQQIVAHLLLMAAHRAA
jgi:hypothetical protein